MTPSFTGEDNWRERRIRFEEGVSGQLRQTRKDIEALKNHSEDVSQEIDRLKKSCILLEERTKTLAEWKKWFDRARTVLELAAISGFVTLIVELIRSSKH